MRRRRDVLLLGVLALDACVRPVPRPGPAQSSGPLPQEPRWEQEAHGLLSDGRETLLTFEVFAAYRLSNADGSAAPAQLTWDPPTSAAWDEATHVVRGFRGRAEQLMQQLSTTAVDTNTWRARRELAEAVHGLLDLGDALVAYRMRIDLLSPGGDGSSARHLLDAAWSAWEANAQRWGVSRGELIGCAS